ncbi:hypothetical protein EJ02DRAFT_426669 [Clathrospora elynae]|uniref:Uncharacterized protein n=1 Tax=Clathrospora elynae TaxID=706981 RepID=A0A6A5SBN9_9PLEO|nr:hypothetical protein EJ02DRAFT_426669 [Clathrospora elynae]
MAFVQVNISGTNKDFEQIHFFDGIGEPVNEKREKNTRGAKKSMSYFAPNPEKVVIPEKLSSKAWKNPEWATTDASKKHWTREDGKAWQYRFGVRKFDAETGEYIAFCMINLKLKNLNSKEWKSYYNSFFTKLIRCDLKDFTGRLAVYLREKIDASNEK